MGSSNGYYRFLNVLILFDFFRLPDGQAIMQAVLVGKWELWKAFKVGIVIIVLYGVSGFLFYHKQISGNPDGGGIGNDVSPASTAANPIAG